MLRSEMVKKVAAAPGSVLLLLALAISPASADQQAGGRSGATPVVVGFADLDLALPAHAETMLDRLEEAGRQACGTHHIPWLVSGSDRRRVRECALQATARAVRELDAPMVTALHDAKAGRAGRRG